MLNLLFVLTIWGMKRIKAFFFILSTTTEPNSSIYLVRSEHLLNPFETFFFIHVVFELMLVYEYWFKYFCMDVVSCFLEPSPMFYCLSFYLALESREYSYFNVGWIQVGERNVCWSFGWLLWGEKEKKKNEVSNNCAK